MMRSRFSPASHTARVLVKRDFLSALKGWGLYVAAFVSLLASSFILRSHLGAIKENNILISSDPLNYPLFISLVVISFYLAIISVISISREKDQGTLEVLFYGPVNCSSYLAAKYIKDMLLYLVMVGFFFVYFGAVSGFTNLAFSWSLVKAIFLSIFLVSCIVSFGLFISSLTSRMRTSIIWLVGILLVFLAVQIFHTMLISLEEEALSSSLLYLRKTLEMVSHGIGWISPFSYLNRGMQSIAIGSTLLYGMSILYSLIYSFVLLVFSVLILEAKGVRG